MNLQNMVCIVTGGASGIGKAIAMRFAREGGRVAVADVEIEAASRTVAEIEAAGGVATALAMDVTNEVQVRAGVAKVVAKWGGVDVLVSNAGVQTVHPIESFPFARLEAVARDPPRRCVPHDAGVLSGHAERRTRGQHRVHRIGTLERSVRSQIRVCHRQARAHRSREDGCEGRRSLWHSRERRVPGIRAHAAGREADPRAGTGARHERERRGEAR